MTFLNISNNKPELLADAVKHKEMEPLVAMFKYVKISREPSLWDFGHVDEGTNK